MFLFYDSVNIIEYVKIFFIFAPLNKTNTMNKLKVTIAGLLIACLGIGVMNAQNSTTTTPAKKTAPKATPTTTAPAGQHLKKDGTPDMRYKENKTAKPGTATPPAGQHMKKDGTPDMRNKENKTAKPATTAPASKKGTAPVKKDASKKTTAGDAK